MDEVVKAIDRQQDEISVNTECTVLVHPEVEKSNSGKSVGYIMRAGGASPTVLLLAWRAW